MRTFPTPGPLVIEVHNRAGEVRLDLSDTATTTAAFSVAGDLPLPWLKEIWGAFPGAGSSPFNEPAVDRVVADFTPFGEGARAGRLYVDTRPAVVGWHSRIDVTITAPLGSEVHVHGQATNVRVTGTVGALTVRTASGDVTADTCADEVRATTASGDVVLGQVAGGVAIRTVAGDVQARSVGGRVVVQSTSGTVRLGRVDGDTAVRTVSGDIIVAEVRRGAARFGTVSGSVDVALRNGAVASVGLSSMSGRVHSDLAVEERLPGSQPDGAENAAPRRPDLDIRVKTVSGDIRLRRSSDAGAGMPSRAADPR